MIMLDEAIVTGLIVVLTELAKQIGVPNRFAPVVAAVLGVAYGLYYGEYDPLSNAIGGLILGLSAIGAWSGPRNVFQKKRNDYSVTVNVDKEKLEEYAKEIAQKMAKGDGDQ